jgi:hypothetical protein
MRPIRTVVLGAAAAAGAFALAVFADGAVGAGAMILGLFLAVAATGLVAAAAVNHWIDRPVLNPVLVAQAAAARCSCGRARASISGMWVCERCDWSVR